ncbi:Allergen [Penicillium frequentans]|uniref:Allergen n=1 Tax=Penicillium frequentans TaxID=3151616 RepID=A0AAD6D899_9EURO|nr:Allergen [Penicillium glabrum]
MTTLQPGDTFPSDVTFQAASPLHAESRSNTMPPRSGRIRRSSFSRFPVPLPPTCSANHVPGYIQNLPKLKEKGVDIIAVLAFNDPFVMSAWGKVNGVRDSILFLSDPDAKFSKSIGWADAASGRTGRYAIVIDHGKISYAQIETERGAVKKSGADAVLASL